MVPSHGIHLTSKTRILCVSNPGQGRTGRPYWRAPEIMHLARGDGGRPRLWAGVRAPGQAGAEACRAEGYSDLVQSLRLTNPTRRLRGRLLLWPRQVHRLSRARQPTANGSIMLTAWEGLERPAVTPSPCSILGFDLPLAIVSKDQGTSITFKGPIEPPGDETSSRGSTLLRQKVPGLGVVFAWGTVWGSTRVWFVYWVGLAFSFF